MEKLLAAAREGRLYMQAEQNVKDASCWKAGAMDYVSAIEKFCTEKWKDHVKELWETLLDNKELCSGIVMRNKRTLNRYFLTGLIYNLQARGVYQDVTTVSQLQLHLCLEHSEKKTTIYKNWSRYPMSAPQRKSFVGIYNQLRASLK